MTFDPANSDDRKRLLAIAQAAMYAKVDDPHDYDYFIDEITPELVIAFIQELEIAQGKYRTAQRHAKGEQRAASKIKKWATTEVRVAHRKTGRLVSERDRMQAERDHAMLALRDIIKGGYEHEWCVDMALGAIEEVTSGQVSDRAMTSIESIDNQDNQEGKL